MSVPTLRVAVVGHTNTGKTSLMRTLMRDVEFGEVSDRPAVTRDVEGAILRAGDGSALELYDTPGLEDSIGLRDHLEQLCAGDRRVYGAEVIERFLADGDERFAQEAKVLRQLMASAAGLYVIDVRDHVLGKHRDELEVLRWCGKPIVPVLNFTAAADARTAEWREALGRLGMHAVAEFDTVVYSADDERRLFEKMATLLDAFRPALESLVAWRADERRRLVRASATVIAELLIDVASCCRRVSIGEEASTARAIEELADRVRVREREAVASLLELHQFRATDVVAQGLDVRDGAWGLDLFSPEAMKEFGIKAGSAAAAGAAVGFTLDVMFGGMSLGAATLAGGALGGLSGAAMTHGRRLIDRARGYTELRVARPTLELLGARQLALLAALLRRGHAAMEAVRIGPAQERTRAAAPAMTGEMWREVARASAHPAWSDLGERPAVPDPARERAVGALAAAIVRTLSAA